MFWKQDVHILKNVRLLEEQIMYNGTNPSALRSREWLTNALLTLLESQKYEEITIKEICREADLSRQTFYQIFDSKDEIVEYQFIRLFTEFKAACGNFEGISLGELSLSFFSFFKKHNDFIRVMTSNNMAYLLEREFEHFLPQIDLFKRINKTEEHPDYSVCYMAGALCQILIHWYDKGMDLPVEEVASLTEQIISGKSFNIRKNPSQ
jgi:AcrR family transcriptional regulator